MPTPQTSVLTMSVGAIASNVDAAIFGTASVATLRFNPALTLQGGYAGNRRPAPLNPWAVITDV